mmetsp:Transcript_22190/g.45032  ORF Transcript_22190/g.45032 Transcript_22190/m.45032 type:complete len:555 (-) Transcript_22190:65-1729(-)|eukprot:CAMPEP_0171347226 /NCGR_PEP_ID=MMETSP0878-20121228/27303_1 /TAXON_ID=67004 /ORGANISM="Thalassiosira weissflogii, Strain CCMP1336" /LENGTH=554 /DNA_ID=CAMNT_0011851189 /DNA_START=44 /DNA_END=1708 /DNA_ORIENTATION=-
MAFRQMHIRCSPLSLYSRQSGYASIALQLIFREKNRVPIQSSKNFISSPKIYHATSLSLFTSRNNQLNYSTTPTLSAPSTVNSASTSLRRRKRRTSILSNDEDNDTNDPNRNDPTSSNSQFESPSFSSSHSTPFTPLNPQTKKPLTTPEYLSLASLSPWVPCPDMVIKRVLEIANASSGDIHVDLGCGDGRFNFAAVGRPWNVKMSWGVDVDWNVLEWCKERLGRRFVPRDGGKGGSEGDNGGGVVSEAQRLEFIQGDLKRVVELGKRGYQQRQGLRASNATTTTFERGEDEEDWSKEEEINQKLSNSTLITMYFVNDALFQLQPYLASILGGKDNVRVVTVGYEMKGWEPDWAERVYDLTVFRYDMKNISPHPIEWNDNDGNCDSSGDGGISATANDLAEISNNNHSSSSNIINEEVDERSNPHLTEYLRQKRKEQQQIELDSGLRIHHDEQLDDFAQFRAKRKAREDASRHGIYANGEGELEDDWDFDEEEDPEDIRKKDMALRRQFLGKGGGRKGMMAGLEDERGVKGCGKKSKGGDGGQAEKNPVWKMPT